MTNPSAMLADPSFAPYWEHGLSNELYHADKTSVSSSGIRKILKSPAHFKHDVLGGSSEAPSEAMQLGTLVHDAIELGGSISSRVVVVPDFTAAHGHYNSAPHKAAKAAWLAAQGNKVVVSQADYDKVRWMVDSIASHPDAQALLKGADIRESSGYWRDAETGIRCRFRPDVLSTRLMALTDIKTTRDASYEEFSKSCWNFRYDIQMAMYGEGVSKVVGKPVQFHTIIAVESVKPFVTAVYTCDDAMIARGMRDFRRGLERLRTCIFSEEWPGYHTSIQNLSLPRWAPEELPA